MQSTLNEQGGCRRELSVEFSAEEVQAKYDELLKSYVKYGQVNGFRPGRAPADLIRRKYGERIATETRDALTGDGYRAALQEHSLKIVAEIDLQRDEVVPGKPFSFRLVIDVAPVFDLPAYKGIALDVRKVDIAPEAVEQAIADFLKRTGTYGEAPEGTAAAQGDMVAVDYTATLDGHPLDEGLEKAKSLASAKDFFVIADEEYSFLPGFGTALIGLAPGASKDIDVTFPDTFPIEELRGKTARFSATVKKIRTRIPRAIDETFCKEMHVADEAEFRKVMRGNLERHALDDEENRLQETVREALLAGCTFDLPAAELESEKNRIVYNLVEENVRRGVPETAIRGGLDQLTSSAAKTAERQLRLRYIFRAIAEDDHLSVSSADVDRWLRGTSSDPAAWLRQTAKREKTTETEVRAEIRRMLLLSKVENRLFELAAWSGEGAAAMRVHMGLDEPAADKPAE